VASFALPEDVEALLQRELTDAEAPAVDMHLAGASAIIRGVVTDVDTRVTAGTLDATIPAYVAASMVVRVMRNPEGWRSVSESIDDYREERTRDQALSDGALRLLADELAILRGRRRGAFSIRPGVEPVTCAILEQVALFRAQRAAWCP
jgi:hypothetical protein